MGAMMRRRNGPIPARERAWSAAARLNAVITTAAMDESTRSAWCTSAHQALADPEEQSASPKETAADRKRIKELEREIRRKDKALAETAALVLLSK